MASLNVRCLKHDEKLYELEQAFEEMGLDILGISEVRRMGENILKTKKENLFCYYGTTLGQKGVGVLISKKLSKKFIEFKPVSERILTVSFKSPKNKVLTLIKVYAPTSAASDEEVEKFFALLSDLIMCQKNNCKYQFLLMGDLNSQVGMRKLGEESILGPYYYGVRNDGWGEARKFLSRKSLEDS